MNVLYLSYDGLTDPLGQSQVLPYIIGLSSKGYEFTLISFEKKDKYQLRKNSIETICKNNNIEWHPFYYTKNPPVISTIYDRKKLTAKAITLHRKKSFEIVHCRSYITSLIGLKLKRKFAIKFIFDMRGFWADERVDGRLWNIKNPIYKKIYAYFKKKEKAFIENSDQIISLTEAGKKEMIQWSFKTPIADKIKIIPCSADFNHFQIQSKKTSQLAKKELEFNDNDFIISYIGSIGTWYMLDEMLLFFKKLKVKKPNAKFLFLTPESKVNILSKAKKIDLKVDDFRIIFSEREKIPYYISCSNFSIFFILPAYSKLSSSPTKMGELLAMGIPLICNKNVGDVEHIIHNTESGFCIDVNNNNEFDHVIENLSTFSYEPESIRQKAKEFYELKNGVAKYLSLYQEIS